MKRCDWATSASEQAYHDYEWGKINKDDMYLFEMLCLEGMQAGLSWKLILDKRQAYQSHFENFDPIKVAQMSDESLEHLLASDANIIKNRQKVFAIRTNATAFLRVKEEFGTFATYIWSFVEGQQIQNNWETIKQVPAQTPLSSQISLDLKKRGFKFIGPIIVYSYLQAIGIINDHLNSCDFK